MVYFLYRLTDQFSRKFRNEFLHKGLFHEQFVSYCIIDIAASHNEIYRIFLLTVPSWASVGLFVFRPTLIYFIHITDDRLHFFTWTYPRHFLSGSGSSACNTYCDTRLPIIMVSPEDLWHSHLLQSVWQWCCYNLFSDYVCRGRDSNTQTSACYCPLLHRRGFLFFWN